MLISWECRLPFKSFGGGIPHFLGNRGEVHESCQIAFTHGDQIAISADGLMELKTDSKLSQQFQLGLSGFTFQNPLNVLTCALVAVRCFDVYSSFILNSLFKQD